LNRDEMDSSIGEIEHIEGEASFAQPAMSIIDITSSFSGAIFRKAEFEDSFDKVYSRVIEKMVQFQFVGHEDRSVLEVFGIVGG
jgi:hypothetical protein